MASEGMLGANVSTLAERMIDMFVPVLSIVGVDVGRFGGEKNQKH
jgi:hypothetical protein